MYWTYLRTWNGLYQGLVIVIWLICNTMAKFSSKNTPEPRIWNDDVIFILISETTSWSSCIYESIVPTATDRFVYYGQCKLQLDFKKYIKVYGIAQHILMKIS